MIDRSSLSTVYGPEIAWAVRPRPGDFEDPADAVAAFDPMLAQAREEHAVPLPGSFARRNPVDQESDPLTPDRPDRAESEVEEAEKADPALPLSGCPGGNGAVAIDASGCQEDGEGQPVTVVGGVITSDVLEGVDAVAPTVEAFQPADGETVRMNEVLESRGSEGQGEGNGEGEGQGQGVRTSWPATANVGAKPEAGDPMRNGGTQAFQGESEEGKPGESVNAVALDPRSKVSIDRSLPLADHGDALMADHDRTADADHVQDMVDVMPVEGTEARDQAPLVRVDPVGGEGLIQEPQERQVPQIPRESVIPDLARRVTEQVGFLRTAGSRSWTVQVEPNSFGAVRLDISVRDHGVTADITTTHPMMRELLDHHQGQLRQALADQGFRVDRFSVNVGDPEQRSSGRSWDQGGHSRPWTGWPEYGPVGRSAVATASFRHAGDIGPLSAVNVYI